MTPLGFQRWHGQNYGGDYLNSISREALSWMSNLNRIQTTCPFLWSKTWVTEKNQGLIIINTDCTVRNMVSCFDSLSHNKQSKQQNWWQTAVGFFSLIQSIVYFGTIYLFHYWLITRITQTEKLRMPRMFLLMLCWILQIRIMSNGDECQW